MSLLAALLMIGCSADEDGITCGPGTVLVDGECVPEDAAGDTGTSGGGDGGTDSGSGDSGGDGGGGDGGGDSGAASYTVCDDGVAPYDDLQAAIDGSADGDTITVCPGTWGPALLDGRSLSLVAPDGPDATRIEDPYDPAFVVRDGADVSLSGFTLSGDMDIDVGGVIGCHDAALDISDSRIADVDAGDDGGYLVYMDECVGTVDGLVVEDNRIRGTTWLVDGGEVTLRHLIVRNNRGTDERGFEGVSGLTLSGGEITLSNSIFARNEVVSMLSSSVRDGRHHIHNNVFYDTVHEDSWQHAVSIETGTIFVNNILADNDASLSDSYDAREYTCFHGNGDDYSKGTDDTDIVEDPWFEDPDAFDFHLDPDFSPCVDAGHPGDGYLDPDGSRSDIGAYGGPYGAW